MHRLAILGLVLMPTTGFSQDGAVQIGWCRIDGIGGGNVTRGAIARACYGGPPVGTAQNAAIAESQVVGAALCPQVNVANATARCQAAGSSFTPAAVPDVEFNQSDGVTSRERAAVAVQKVGTSGACTFSRITESTTDTNDGTCQSWWGSTWPKASATVLVRTYCGYICR